MTLKSVFSGFFVNQMKFCSGLRVTARRLLPSELADLIDEGLKLCLLRRELGRPVDQGGQRDIPVIPADLRGDALRGRTQHAVEANGVDDPIRAPSGEGNHLGEIQKNKLIVIPSDIRRNEFKDILGRRLAQARQGLFEVPHHLPTLNPLSQNEGADGGGFGSLNRRALASKLCFRLKSTSSVINGAGQTSQPMVSNFR